MCLTEIYITEGNRDGLKFICIQMQTIFLNFYFQPNCFLPRLLCSAKVCHAICIAYILLVLGLWLAINVHQDTSGLEAYSGEQHYLKSDKQTDWRFDNVIT